MSARNYASLIAALAAATITAGCHGSSAPTCSFANPGSLAPSSWPKFRGDLRNTGTTTAVAFPPATQRTPQVRQTYVSTEGATFVTSPVLGNDGPTKDGRIYISFVNVFYALDTTTNNLQPLGATRFTPFTAERPITEPAVAAIRYNSDAVYFGSGDGRLESLDSKGNVFPGFWPFGLVNGITSAPNFNGVDGTVFATGGTLFFAVCPNGIERYGFSFSQRILSAPGVGTDGSVYFHDGENLLRAINGTGVLSWTFATSAPVQTAIVVDVAPGPPEQTQAIFMVDANGHVFKISAAGQQMFNVDLGESVTGSSPALAGGFLYVISDAGTLFAVDKSSISGQAIPVFTTNAAVHSSPAVIDYQNGTVLVIYGADDGNVYFVQVDQSQTPQLVKSVAVPLPLGAKIESSPAVGCPPDDPAGATCKPTVYIGADNGMVYGIS